MKLDRRHYGGHTKGTGGLVSIVSSAFYVKELVLALKLREGPFPALLGPGSGELG